MMNKACWHTPSRTSFIILPFIAYYSFHVCCLSHTYLQQKEMKRMSNKCFVKKWHPWIYIEIFRRPFPSQQSSSPYIRHCRRTIVGRKSKLKKILCLSSLVSTQPVRAPSGAAVRKVEARDERHKIAYSSHFLLPIVEGLYHFWTKKGHKLLYSLYLLIYNPLFIVHIKGLSAVSKWI